MTPQKDPVEFCRLANGLSNHKVKTTRYPRAYFTPDLIDKYTCDFREHAAEDGRLTSKVLGDLYSKYELDGDRVSQSIRDVERDFGGILDEDEFLGVLSKVMCLKKRKVGPGSCDLAQLALEGWSPSELKKLGYDYEAFVQYGGFSFRRAGELLDLFSAPELRRAGVSLKTMVQSGWDFSRAREAGFTIQELVQAGCPPRRVWDAGWDLSPTTTAELRGCGVSASELRAAGLELSELRMAGYSSAELRVAGFAAHAVASMDMLLQAKNGWSKRRNTLELRRPPADAEEASEDVVEKKPSK
jgi:hypothetical protein